MNEELRILILEDAPADVEMAMHELKKAGRPISTRVASSRETFIAALEEFNPNIVLADYRLPSFDGISAIRIIREKYPHIPVIVLSGTLGDEKAVETLREGAFDYVAKSNMLLLMPAIERALHERRELAAKKKAEEELALRNNELRALNSMIQTKLNVLFDSLRRTIVEEDTRLEEIPTENAKAHFRAFLKEVASLIGPKKVGDKWKILIADDDQGMLNLVSATLGSDNYELFVAKDGEEALMLVKKESPDLLILDIMMPRVDGLQVCRILRADPATSKIKIILLTGDKRDSERKLGAEAGADAYMIKPFSPTALMVEVDKVLLA